MAKRPTIGLALGSGSAKGLAHIGVIKALEEHNIPIDFIAGSSIGALVGGFYAAGLSVVEMEKIASETDWRRMFSLIDPDFKRGLLGGEKVTTFIDGYLKGKRIEDCTIPFSAVATDFKTGEAVVLDTGEMASAIRASISIPMIFKPVEMNGRTLADGGLSAPVPVEIVRKMGADIVIAVNLDKHYSDEEWKSGWYDIVNDSVNILRHHLALLNVLNADVTVDIDTGKSLWYQFTNGQDKILIGKKATEELLPKLNEVITHKSIHGLKKYLDFFRS